MASAIQEGKKIKPRLKMMPLFLADGEKYYRFGHPIKEKVSSFICHDFLDNPFYVAKTNVVKLKGLPEGCEIATLDDMGSRCSAKVILRDEWSVGTPLVISYGSITAEVDCKCLLIEKAIMARLIVDGFAFVDQQVDLDEDSEEDD